MIDIKIGKKSYKVKEAKTDEELSKGLKGVESLSKDEGMLFYIPNHRSQEIFTMKDCLIPLDIIFINQDQEVIYVAEDCQPGEKRIVSTTEYLEDGDYIAYVLEVNPKSGIKLGDELEFEEDESEPIMKVLFPNGEEQMPLFGGERIFSRQNTKVLIKKAKKAQMTQEDKDFKALGRYMFKCLRIQDSNNPEYVEVK